MFRHKNDSIRIMVTSWECETSQSADYLRFGVESFHKMCISMAVFLLVFCDNALRGVQATTPSSQCCFFRHRYNQITLTQAGRTSYVHIDRGPEGGSTVYSRMLKGCYSGEVHTLPHDSHMPNQYFIVQDLFFRSEDVSFVMAGFPKKVLRERTKLSKCVFM